jgi:Ca2+:H+ antiporter
MLKDFKQFLFGSWLNLLLILVPVSVLLEWLHAPPLWVFFIAALAIVPLAALIGAGTEATAEHTGPGIGGLLNATFGNATELIIALFAVHRGLFGVVKASITGSILGNMLLVLGLSMLIGGWGRDRQTFNRTAAGSSAAMLILAVTALALPALWDLVVFGRIGPTHPRVQLLSDLAAGVLLATYVASLIFSLRTHHELFSAVGHGAVPQAQYRLSSGVAVLLVATILTAVESEILVGAIEAVGKTLGLTEIFIGVVVVAVVGNAAEHFTAVLVAKKNQMDLAFHIAIGSSTQIALLVAPILVFASYFLHRTPMDLVFSPFEILALTLAVVIVAVVSLDGESNWFEGVQLIALYLMLAIAFYFVPAAHAS